MVVKNYRIFITKGQNYTVTNGTQGSGYGDYDNGLRTDIIPNNTSNNIDNTWNSGYRVITGSGDTPPTENDYNVEVASGLSHRGTVANPLTEKQIYNITSNYSNETSESIIVKELALVTKFRYSGGSMKAAIIARKVLDTPITVLPGEQYGFTYIIEMNLSNES